MAERIVRARSLRAEVFGILNDGFGEPAWDILLELFIAGEHQRISTVESLIDRTGVPAATAKTYVGFLASHRAIVAGGATLEEACGQIASDATIALSERGRARLTEYLEREARL